MTELPASRLRAALEDVAREAGRELSRGPLVEIGRPLLGALDAIPRVTHDAVPQSLELGGGLAWGTLSPEARSAWLAQVPIGAATAQVFASARPGARGVLDRVMLLAARESPQPLEEVCTALFLAGVGALRVIELEPRRNVVGVVGIRRF